MRFLGKFFKLKLFGAALLVAGPTFSVAAGCGSGVTATSERDGGDASRDVTVSRGDASMEEDAGDEDGFPDTGACCPTGPLGFGYDGGCCCGPENPWYCGASVIGNWCAPTDQTMDCEGGFATGPKCVFGLPDDAPDECLEGNPYICCTGEAATQCACATGLLEGEKCYAWMGLCGHYAAPPDDGAP